MNDLDDLIKKSNFGAVLKLSQDPDFIDLITEKTLNIAILSGHNLIVTKLLDAGATANEDTITCALFSGLLHVTVTRLLDLGADINNARKYAEHSNMHHPVRSRIKGEPVQNVGDNPADALKFATENLSFLTEKYGQFRGLEWEVKREKERNEQESQDVRYEQKLAGQNTISQQSMSNSPS